jgi:hypothetical protein
MNYKYQPEDYNGTSDNPNWEADLNCIDTSQINRMFGVFSILYGDFNGDISRWNVEKVVGI